MFSSFGMMKLSEEPIMSYGIIAFYVENETPLILLYQRRDTFGYVDIVKGFWETEYDLEKLLELTTRDERRRLLKYGFDDIWNDLWVDHTHFYFKKEYSKCKEKFEKVKKFMNTERYKLKKFSTTRLEWGFPKGKKHYKESELECAFREFREETGIPTKKLTLVNRDPIIEYYRGNNNRPYGTMYYVCEINSKVQPLFLELTGRIRKQTLTPESNTFKLVPIAKANRILITHHKKMLRKAIKRIDVIMNQRF